MRGGGRAAPAAWALATALGLPGAGVHGQPGGRDMPALEGLRPLGEIPVLATPAVVRSASRIEAEPAGGPAPFAEPFAVEVTPAGRGAWEVTSDGRFAVWRLRVTSSGALSLNFGFTRYRMPPGGSLRIHAADGGESIGPFTEVDNEAHGQLWTPVVSGGDAVIEVAVPVGREEELELELASVNRGFRDLFPTVVRTPAHGSCHIDVACPEADPYRDQVRSAGFYTLGGQNVCSGALVNNTARDRKPWFVTAEHCFRFRLGSAHAWAATTVVYWNRESPACGARTGGPGSHTQSGATLVARHQASDFLLLLLDDDVDPAHDLYFAGWSADPAVPSSAFAIHHPRGHVKSISTTSGPLTATGIFSSDPEGREFLRTPFWDSGSMDRGSSGSPLFGPDRRVVGVHTGGDARCGNKESSWSGRVASAWLGRAVPDGRLIDWLDEVGTGETGIDGMPWNYAPEAAGTLHGKSLRLADGALEVDVAHGFLDRDGDALVFTVSSSDETVATAAITGSTVTVSPVAAGTVTVTVTASDGKTDDLSRTFAVTVGANRSPEPVGTLAALSLSLADGAASVDVSAAFEDDDGDTLTYAASSSDESVATVSVSGSTVTVTPVSGGRSVIAVTATDAAGSNTSARQGFDATVANRAPQASGALPDLSLVMKLGGRGKKTLDLRPAFRDPDGDLVTWSASSSDDSVATVSMWRWWATVNPVKAGSATITVSATDPAGSNTATSRTFAVMVSNGPPEVLASAPRRLDTYLARGAAALDLTKVFADPEGDDLSWAATSAAPAVAAVALSGAKATVSPKAFGSTVLTATATDTGGSNATVSHRIEVRVLNSPPVVTGWAPPPILMRVGDPDREVDVARMFTDPDGDALTYSCSSAYARMMRIVRVTGSRVTIRPVGLGDSVLRCEASDGGPYVPGRYKDFPFSVDRRGWPAISVDSPSVSEGAGRIVFRVALTGNSNRSVSVDYATSDGTGAGGARAGVDYEAANGTLSLTDYCDLGRSGLAKCGTVAVRIMDDTDDAPAGEEEKTLLLTLSNPRNVPLVGGGATLQGRGTIRDDDPAVEVSFDALSHDVAEGGSATVTVRLDRDPKRDLEIFLERTHRGGAAAADYSGVPSSVTFASGETSRTFEVAAADDEANDDGESVLLRFATPLPDGVTAKGEATLVLADNDDSATVTPETLTVEEGTTGSYTVALDSRPAGTVTVRPVVPPNVDVEAAPRRLAFGPGDWERARTVTVRAAEDADALNDPLVTIVHEASNGGGSVAVASVTVAVVEKDVPTLSAGGARASESEGSLVFRVALSTESSSPVTVDYATSDGSARAGSDYEPAAGTLSFPAGSTSSRRIFVSVMDDDEDEGAQETLHLTLRNAVNASLAGGGSSLRVAGTIRDDDRRDDGPPTGGPPTGGPPTGGPGGPGGPPPPPDDEEDDEDDGDDGGPPPGVPPPGGPPPGGGGPPRAAMETDAECEAGLCRARTGEPVSFRDASAGSVRSRMWEFGDGRRSRSASPSHAWASPGFHEVALLVSDGSVDSTASLMFLVDAAEPAGTCAADAWTRCLGDSRYAVTVEWRGAGGETGRGRVAPAGTNESGMFRFFDASNWEVLIKVLDGCDANGHAWVFGASTTDLGYVIRVMDTATAAVKEYRNEPGTAAAAITDVKAFPEGCRR